MILDRTVGPSMEFMRKTSFENNKNRINVAAEEFSDHLFLYLILCGHVSIKNFV